MIPYLRLYGKTTIVLRKLKISLYKSVIPLKQGMKTPQT